MRRVGHASRPAQTYCGHEPCHVVAQGRQSARERPRRIILRERPIRSQLVRAPSSMRQC